MVKSGMPKNARFSMLCPSIKTIFLSITIRFLLLFFYININAAACAAVWGSWPRDLSLLPFPLISFLFYTIWDGFKSYKFMKSEINMVLSYF